MIYPFKKTTLYYMQARVITIIFFLLVFALSLIIYKDYGISLDEPAQRLIGIVNVNYVAEVFGINSILQNPHFANFFTQNLAQIQDRHYGVIYEFPAALLELAINPSDEKAIFEARHLLNFFYFLFGLISIYHLTVLRFKNWSIGLLACVILILSPRFFADAFYNNKDIIFLSAYTFAAYTMIRFLIEPTLKRVIIHSLASAIAIDTRLISIAIPILTVVFLMTKLLRKDLTRKELIKPVALYLMMSILFIIAFFPYLWANPLMHLIESFRAISQHLHSGSILYFGSSVPNNMLPWHYLPIWIGITTPFLYIVFFCIGSLSIFYEIVISKLKIFRNQDQIMDLIFIGLLIGPVIAVASLHTHIYNGWRHLYFVYPFFILIAIKGFQVLWRFNYKFIQVGLISVLILNFCFIGSWMFVNHPLQNLYFNFLAGKNWNSLFEVDYWGLANRTALQKILSYNSGESITIWPGRNSKFKSGEPTVYSDQLMLEASENKFKVSSPDNIEDSKYIIASNRANYSLEYLSKHGVFQKIDSVKIDGQEILGIFHQRKNSELPLPQKNQKIFFGNSGLGIFYLYDGQNPPVNWEKWTSAHWQIPESWGTWSKGHLASIRLPVPSEEINKLILQLRAFITPTISEQNIEIWVDGYLIKSTAITSKLGQEVTINLPKNLKPSTEILIEFRGLKPQSPQQNSLSQDNRQIAIGIESLEFL
jgi:Dolichyl-phosphate-mannose-protein mannosyltransferase